MAFSKLKAHLRAACARTFETMFAALSDICALFTKQQCSDFIIAAGYASD